MFRLIIFTLIGVFAVVMLHDTPEMATGRYWVTPPAASVSAGGPVGTTAGLDEKQILSGPATASTDRLTDGAASTASAGFLARLLARDGAPDDTAGPWIEIRDAAGNRSFIRARIEASNPH